LPARTPRRSPERIFLHRSISMKGKGGLSHWHPAGALAPSARRIYAIIEHTPEGARP
jgi:hypothetical protein